MQNNDLRPFLFERSLDGLQIKFDQAIVLFDGLNILLKKPYATE